jgi:hypothetical protein
LLEEIFEVVIINVVIGVRKFVFVVEMLVVLVVEVGFVIVVVDVVVDVVVVGQELLKLPFIQIL